MSASVDVPPVIALGLVGAAVVAFYVWKKGGLTQAASGAGAAIVNAAGSAASGAVGAIGAGVGLPTPDETTTDPAVARWIIDRAGYFEASKWSGAPALFSATFMDAGSGKPPPLGSAIAAAFPPVQMTTGDFTRSDHGYEATPPDWSQLWSNPAGDTIGLGL